MALQTEDIHPTFVVGIGGSAGGLEAFGQFFAKMPSDSGMAFVVVQHLDPNHKAMLAELLQKSTSMRVREIEDGVHILANSVYVIPPNRDISILDNKLHLLEPVEVQGLRLPVDFFFRQLAEDQKDRSIGIILSGMGTDGTLGLRAIKEHLGAVLVQDPGSAKFDGMPRSAIATGLADYVAPVEELPSKLVEFTRQVSRSPKHEETLSEEASSALQKVFILLRSRTGNDFSLYKKGTIQRRIKRRMDVHLISRLNDYVRYLQKNPQEVELLFRELLIGVTSFFRDEKAYEVLEQQVVSKLSKHGEPEAGVIRAWVVGCSTGEEAYSTAIVLRECLDAIPQATGTEIQIFATDIDKEAIDVARKGSYDSNIAADVSPERLQRFFVKEDDTYRVRKEIRDMMIFAPHNVTMDPPFTRMDLVSCRNLLIYFSSELQNKVVPVLHYSLNPGGLLFLGPSETISGFGELFSTLDSKWRVFRKRSGSTGQLGITDFPVARRIPGVATTVAEPTSASITETAQNAILESYSPPAVLINADGDILYINGRIGRYMEPSPGKANMNIYAMARDEIRYELGGGIRQALQQKVDIILKGLRVQVNGHEQVVDVTVKPLVKRDAPPDLLLVVFQEVAMQRKPRRSKHSVTDEHTGRIAELEEELVASKKRLQATIEQMQVSQEELQSTNEELQSANEELQSTNEELTTSREEMQSLNEELGTVNAELQSKVEELSYANNDMRNLLNSTDIATIFLNNDLRIRRFTSQATEIFKMIETDVGRPITDLVSRMRDDQLARDARAVLDSLNSRQRQVKTEDGRWYIMKTMPYRTLENMIAGVVVTFSDITPLKELEWQLKDERSFAEGIVATVREPLLVLDQKAAVVVANKSFYQSFQVTPDETEGRLVYTLGNGQWDIPALRTLIQKTVKTDKAFEGFVVENDFPTIGHRRMILNARRIKQDNERGDMIRLVIDEAGHQRDVN